MRAAFSFLPRQLRARPLACFAVAFLLGLLAAARLAVPPWATGVALLSASALGIALRSRRAAAGALLLIVLVMSTRVSGGSFLKLGRKKALKA